MRLRALYGACFAYNATMDRLIYKTQNFAVKVPTVPHVPREDGGHIFIEINDHSIAERAQLSPGQSVELTWLLSLTGQAYWDVMPERGLDLYRLNYQDNGNWAFVRGETPVLHVHVYGRTRNEAHQEYGQALRFPYVDTGFYDTFEALTAEDIAALRQRICDLAATPRFQDECWKPQLPIK